MKKFIVAAAVAAVALAATPASAIPGFPAAPACVSPSISGGDLTAPWAEVEADCGVSLAGSPREFVSFVENYADYLAATGDASGRAYQSTLADRDATIAAQAATIDRKVATIKRLRERLARTHR